MNVFSFPQMNLFSRGQACFGEIHIALASVYVHQAKSLTVFDVGAGVSVLEEGGLFCVPGLKGTER